MDLVTQVVAPGLSDPPVSSTRALKERFNGVYEDGSYIHYVVTGMYEKRPSHRDGSL